MKVFHKIGLFVKVWLPLLYAKAKVSTETPFNSWQGGANHTLFQSINSSAEWCRQGNMVSATENFQSDIFIYETPNSQCLTIQLNCEEESNPFEGQV